MNFSCDVGSFQIKHLSDLRNLYDKLFEFEIFFGDVQIDVGPYLW